MDLDEPDAPTVLLPGRLMMTTGEVAAALDTDAKTIRLWAARPSCPAWRTPTGHWRFPTWWVRWLLCQMGFRVSQYPDGVTGVI